MTLKVFSPEAIIASDLLVAGSKRQPTTVAPAWLGLSGSAFSTQKGRRSRRAGAALSHLQSIDLAGVDPRLGTTEILVACDVDNPLTGPRGASAVYGPQKGATPEMVAELDLALEHFARIAQRVTGRDVADRRPERQGGWAPRHLRPAGGRRAVAHAHGPQQLADGFCHRCHQRLHDNRRRGPLDEHHGQPEESAGGRGAPPPSWR